MKSILSSILFIISLNLLFADIAPNPIVIKGIYTVDDCKIQMTNEYVFANLYNDSARVECTFDLENFSDATRIQIGFPEMNFHYWSIGEYQPTDKANFRIFIDGRLLSEKDIQVPNVMDSVYKKYMSVYFYDKEYIRKRDSIYAVNGVKVKPNKTIYPAGVLKKTEKAIKELFQWRQSKPCLGSKLSNELNKQKALGNFPWYVWNVSFNRHEKKQIKVVYTLPSGLGYGSNFRYFKYVLETGSGWYKTINKAEIKLQIHNIKFKNIESISPNNFQIDTRKKTIKWIFFDLEPTSKDDIYLRYYRAKERRHWKKYRRKKIQNQKLNDLRAKNGVG